MIYVLTRTDPSDPSDTTMVRAYPTLDVALAAIKRLEAYVDAADVPPTPDGGLYQMQRVGGETLYRFAVDGPWLDEAQACRASPLWDAQRQARYWWGRANPVDPGWLPGYQYEIVPVEDAQ